MDEHAIVELVLYAVNDGMLYRTRRQKMQAVMEARWQTHTYQTALALRSWKAFINDAALRYVKEFEGPLFPASVRTEAAVRLRDDWEAEMGVKNA